MNGQLAPRTALAAALILCAGCGAGTAALLSGSDDGGSSNALPVLSGFAVVDPTSGGPPKTSPARLRFVLSDRESNPAQVELLYAVGSGAPRRLSQLTDIPANPALLPATRANLRSTTVLLPQSRGSPAVRRNRLTGPLRHPAA